MTTPSKKIFISAGEASGDLLGANLAKALLKKDPTLQLTGMGDEHMKNAGVSIVFDAKKLAHIGIAAVLRNLHTIFLQWRAIKKYLTQEKPDLVILIDLPDTHFRIMKHAKKIGIPVLYYVSPQIWAWRASRIHTLKKYVDHMAVLFPFEENIYRDAGIPVTFVGHPLGDLVKPTLSPEAAFDFFKLNADQPIITLLPGSRTGELKNHLSIMLESAERIRTQKPLTQFVLVLANRFNPSDFTLPSYINIVQKNFYDVLQITTACIAVSGTVTLEVALMQTPLCIIYKLDPVSFWIAKKLIHVKHIGLCNIVSKNEVAKELIQNDANPETISTEILKLLSNQTYYDEVKARLHGIKNCVSIQDENSSDKVADIALGMLFRQ